MASFPCIYCSTEVRPRQQALQCDGCDQWQHRTCDTGITQEDYRRMVRGEIGDQQWYCVQCLPPEITGKTRSTSPLLQNFYYSLSTL